MAKKAVDPQTLRANLFQGYPGDSGGELPPGEPVTVTQMVLDIDQIKPYDRNPRQEPNPRYEEIKDSIRAQGGLNNAIEVTRRPGEEQYMVRAGGNTRLAILHELAEETGDDRYRKVHVLYHPWTDETALLTAHMVENELRGEMSLIDKALGIEQLRADFEAEAGEAISRSELQRRLKETGYTVSRRQLIRLEFAARTLYPVLPRALRGGLGNASVDKLRALVAAAHEVASGYGVEGEDVDMVFEESMSRTDSPDWSVDAGRQAFEADLADWLRVDLRTLRMELDTQMREGGSREPADDAGRAGPDAAESPPATSADGTPEPTAEPNTAGEREAEPESGGMSTPSVDYPEPSPEESGPAPANDAPLAGATDDVATLRRRCFEAANRLAHRYQLGAHLQPIEYGLGFAVDKPPEDDHVSVHAALNAADRAAREWAWWYLLYTSEVIATPERTHHVYRRWQGHYRLGQDLLSDDESLEWEPWDPRPSPLLTTEWLQSPEVDDGAFADAIDLITVCRRLAQAARRQGVDLWQEG